MNKLQKIEAHKSIYMFSLDESVDESILKNAKNYSLEPISHKILQVYNRFIKLSKEVDK